MITIYHNPRCSKSREALQILREAGKEVEVVEYLKQPPTEDELRDVLSKLNLPVEYLIRTKDPLYKSEFKGKSLTDDEWISILVKNPQLLERPIVFNGETAVLGRPPENVDKLL